MQSYLIANILMIYSMDKLRTFEQRLEQDSLPFENSLFLKFECRRRRFANVVSSIRVFRYKPICHLKPVKETDFFCSNEGHQLQEKLCKSHSVTVKKAEVVPNVKGNYRGF